MTKNCVVGRVYLKYNRVHIDIGKVNLEGKKCMQESLNALSRARRGIGPHCEHELIKIV